VAKNVGLNVYKLKRGFKEVYNISVFKYLTEQRLNLAYQYLKETQKTAAEIAFQLGYATPQHFSHMFKKRFGITPHQVKDEV
jgi:AraC-like DNA-binding protein